MVIATKNVTNDSGFGQKRMFPGNAPINTGGRLPRAGTYTDPGDYLQKNPATDKYAGTRSLYRTADFFVNPNQEEHVNHIPVVKAARISAQTENLLLIGFIVATLAIILLNRK